VTARTVTFVVEFAAMALVWNTVMVAYHVASKGRWRRTPAGRHVMAMAACLAWNADLVLLNVVFPHYSGRFAVQVISYAVPTLVGIQRFILMVRQLRHERTL
jgi:hypothetical protein